MDEVAEIKDRLGVEEVVGEYVQLKQAGHNFKGLCPFHHEKTPSFVVSPDKGIYHCFGCSEGGDIFSFVQKVDGLDFRGALELLARKAGVELPEKSADSGKIKQRKEKAYEMLEKASKYYHILLSKNETAKDYVIKTRGFSTDTIKTFKLGWSPEKGDSLVAFLKKEGYQEQEIIDAGLANKRGGRLLDMFRGRIIVPFIDSQGRVVGFTGRVLKDDGNGPKYLNTAQTIVFDKGRFVFGLYQAKDSIRKKDESIVVEGNLDVISSHQAGEDNVVAMSGTAVTTHQLKALSRLSQNIVLAFDADEAGIKATERIIPLAQDVGVNLYIATVPEGKDPDDIIRQDPKQWQKVLQNKDYVMDWLINSLKDKYDLSQAQAKREFTTRISGSLLKIKDAVEKEHYINQVADLVGVAPSAITDKLSATQPTIKKMKSVSEEARTENIVHDDIKTVLGALLSLTTTYADTRSALSDIKKDHLPEELLPLIQWLNKHEEEIADVQLPKSLQSLDNYVKILLLKGEEIYGSWNGVDRQVEAFSLTHRLEELQNKRYKQQLSQDIAAAEAAGDTNLRQKLLKEYQQANKSSQ
ncbi:MAG: DNA primase [Candidatus Saccharimonadales bacterium]